MNYSVVNCLVFGVLAGMAFAREGYRIYGVFFALASLLFGVAEFLHYYKP